HFASIPADLIGWMDWLERAEKLAHDLPNETGFWGRAMIDQIRGLRRELDAVCPWLSVLREIPDTERREGLLAELNTPASVRSWAQRLPAIRGELEKRAGMGSLTTALYRSTAPQVMNHLIDLASRSD